MSNSTKDIKMVIDSFFCLLKYRLSTAFLLSVTISSILKITYIAMNKLKYQLIDIKNGYICNLSS